MSSAAISTIKPLDEAGLTEKEIKLLASAWLASSSTDLDIDKFAAIAGYPSPANARKRFGEAKNRARAKIFGSGASPSGPASASAKPDGVESPLTPKSPKKSLPKTPKSNTKRKSPASSNASTGSEGPSPKRGRTLKQEGDEDAPSVAEAGSE